MFLFLSLPPEALGTQGSATTADAVHQLLRPLRLALGPPSALGSGAGGSTPA